MLLIILWLIQDFLTVLSGGGMEMPGLFMLGLVYKILFDETSDSNLWAIWGAFAGGILWDLRWLGIPGFFTLGNIIVVLIVIQFWGAMPPQGRTSGMGFFVFILIEVSQILPPLIPVLILGGRVWNFFFMQQIYSLPVILITMSLYLRRLKNENASKGLGIL